MTPLTLPTLLVAFAASYLTLVLAAPTLAADLAGIYAVLVFALTVANLRKEWRRHHD